MIGERDGAVPRPNRILADWGLIWEQTFVSFAVSLLFLGVAGPRQWRQGRFQIASSLFDVKGASMIPLDNKDEHGDNLYLAGEKVPPGCYKQVESGRIVTLEEEDFLPASLDGRIACYLAIWHVSKRQPEESNT